MRARIDYSFVPSASSRRPRVPGPNAPLRQQTTTTRICTTSTPTSPPKTTPITTSRYEDVLATDRPFPQPVPLAEMVDFLVDCWDADGLYD